ncbi:hypothetical protein ACFL5G_04255 [Candidatus Margulisiibacteriota bacterium]
MTISGCAWREVDVYNPWQSQETKAPASQMDKQESKKETVLECSDVIMPPFNYFGIRLQTFGLWGAPEDLMFEAEYKAASAMSDREIPIFDTDSGSTLDTESNTSHGIHLATSFPIWRKFNMNLHLGWNLYIENMGGDYAEPKSATGFDVGLSLNPLTIKDKKIFALDVSVTDIPLNKDYAELDMTRLRLDASRRFDGKTIFAPTLRTGATIGLHKDPKFYWYGGVQFDQLARNSRNIDASVGAGFDLVQGINFNGSIDYQTKAGKIGVYASYSTGFPMSPLSSTTVALRYSF